jgi:uncharacterized protein (DUF427 family)
MKIPGPDHPITVTPQAGLVRVRFNGETVAESRRALRLQEAHYPPVFYIPRADARMELFTRSDTGSHCPYKGDASYYSLAVGGRRAVDAVWSYETPYPSVIQIAGHLAFYPDRVDGIEAIAD